jgi:hypothetical protein
MVRKKYLLAGIFSENRKYNIGETPVFDLLEGWKC